MNRLLDRTTPLLDCLRGDSDASRCTALIDCATACARLPSDSGSSWQGFGVGTQVEGKIDTPSNRWLTIRPDTSCWALGTYFFNVSLLLTTPETALTEIFIQS
ncbi:hypothetical protein ARMGADRAFT_784830 [Armillaria gallica]|uniref:Uncharacterized protein n=1 Tax=Armillaria gallica TaxID=47427 RepID=A0A2H3CE06_ARMGA|nr:hypothetical protein ARMGADRAFT_784830 [Armillaria gallica]